MLQNADLFEALAVILQQDLDEVARTRRSKDAYEKPAFAEFMADCNGAERTINKVLGYLNLKKGNENNA